MKIIGITGPSGSGKTTLSDLLRKNYKSFVIDADQVARNLSNNPETKYFKAMIKLFGSEVLNQEGKLNRKK